MLGIDVERCIGDNMIDQNKGLVDTKEIEEIQ